MGAVRCPEPRLLYQRSEQSGGINQYPGGRPGIVQPFQSQVKRRESNFRNDHVRNNSQGSSTHEILAAKFGPFDDTAALRGKKCRRPHPDAGRFLRPD